MANLVMSAVGSLIPKLHALLKEEYNLQTGMKERISSLTKELEFAQAWLSDVDQVPWDQLHKLVQLYAREVREASYDMEDVLDTFLVHVQGPNSTEPKSLLKRSGETMANLFSKSKVRRETSVNMKDIMSHLKEVTERCCRYKVDDIVARHIVARPAISSTVDPRLHAMYNKVEDLVGIKKPSDELISMLQSPLRDNASNIKRKIVSIVGVGGLGKTTLAKVVYDELKRSFNCGAFVPVGRNPDLKKVLKDILMDLGKERRFQFSAAVLDERQLINELRSFIKNKRYFLVIDDIWDTQSWEKIKLAIFDDSNCGGRIIITTRKTEVAKLSDEVYKIQPLPDDRSRELFFARIGDHEGKFVGTKLDEITSKFMKKCGGIPLAIITMASLLAGKTKDHWSELYETIDFGCKDNKEAENTMRILSYSYYDMPSHLRTCLLYLSAFPEDSVISKDSLVWMWVAEGFVPVTQGTRLFEIGEGYFNDLINRSMIQAVRSINDDSIITGCRVHDMVLDFICLISSGENFFTVLDNDQGTLPQSIVPRRLAQQKRAIGVNDADQPKKLRSFIALECVINDTCVPLSRFKLLRVLAIEECKHTDGRPISIEHLGNLLHLRFLRLRGTSVERIPDEIGALRLLQTLDLSGADILELPSRSCCFPKQLVCLRITLDGNANDNTELFSVESLTSLEELSISVWPENWKSRRWHVKGLGNLKELRVVSRVDIFLDEESETDFVESLPHLHKLEHLTFRCYGGSMHEPNRLVLPSRLWHLDATNAFHKLPPCIAPSCIPYLCGVNQQEGKRTEHKKHVWSSTSIIDLAGSMQLNAAKPLPFCRCHAMPCVNVLVHNPVYEPGKAALRPEYMTSHELQWPAPLPNLCSRAQTPQSTTAPTEHEASDDLDRNVHRTQIPLKLGPVRLADKPWLKTLLADLL